MKNNLIAKLLLQINAIKLNSKNPFTWSSGKKSPIYCDNRLILSHPQIRSIIQEELVKCCLENYKNSNLIAGVATAGIPHGILIAHKMKLPFIYVRDQHKKHGRQNKIEGEIGNNRNVLIVEDLISTGKSSLNVAKTLKKKNCEITGIISIFNYNFTESEYLMKTHNIKALSLCNFHELITQAKKSNYISDEEYENILNWHSNFNFS